MSWWSSMQFDPKFAGIIASVLAEGGRTVDISTGKITPVAIGVQHDTPWIFVKPAYQPYCAVWNADYWRRFGLIPEFCRTRCHKVVVKLQNVAQLFDFWQTMESLGFPGKLGLDLRAYTFGPYAAFFYCTSMDEGQKRYDIVRKTVDATLGKDVVVILKKGCTEMEHRLFNGKPSTQWGEPTEEDKVKEMMLNDIFALVDDKAIQPEWLKNYIAFGWLKYAYQIGDEAVFDVMRKFGIDDLFGDPPKTYHPPREASADSVKSTTIKSNGKEVRRVQKGSVKAAKSSKSKGKGG